MTPAAGAGIKYAIEDAVVAANVLTEPLQAGQVTVGHLAEVQREAPRQTRQATDRRRQATFVAGLTEALTSQRRRN